MSANAVKSLANARSPCRGGNRLLWKNDTAANSTEHPGAEAGFWGGTGTAAESIAERPDAHHGAARACRSNPCGGYRLVAEHSGSAAAEGRRLHAVVRQALFHSYRLVPDLDCIDANRGGTAE